MKQIEEQKVVNGMEWPISRGMNNKIQTNSSFKVWDKS